MKVKLDTGAFMPVSAHEADAGYDLFAVCDFTIPAGKSMIHNTGVHMEIPKGYVGFLKSKSGLNAKSGILCEGVIDSGYNGAIITKLYNHSRYDKQFRRGDKITQIVFLPILKPELELTETLGETERGDGGFGSTGR